MEIARGGGLQAAADELQISLTTARTHLQHVFEKTETQRQAELVRLVTAGALYVRQQRLHPEWAARLRLQISLLSEIA